MNLSSRSLKTDVVMPSILCRIQLLDNVANLVLVCMVSLFCRTVLFTRIFFVACIILLYIVMSYRPAHTARVHARVRTHKYARTRTYVRSRTCTRVVLRSNAAKTTRIYANLRSIQTELEQNVALRA